VLGTIISGKPRQRHPFTAKCTHTTANLHNSAPAAMCIASAFAVLLPIRKVPLKCSAHLNTSSGQELQCSSCGHIADTELLCYCVRSSCSLQSYSPYTHCPSGVALVTSSGQVAAGGYIESAAHNPGLPPLQTAVVGGIVGGCLPTYDQV
jgi:hypothetical protein